MGETAIDDAMQAGGGNDAGMSPPPSDPPPLVAQLSKEMEKRHARARAFALGIPFTE